MVLHVCTCVSNVCVLCKANSRPTVCKLCVTCEAAATLYGKQYFSTVKSCQAFRVAGGESV